MRRPAVSQKPRFAPENLVWMNTKRAPLVQRCARNAREYRHEIERTGLGGRGRGGDRGLTHEVKVEARATNEGMPADGSPDTPMAVMVESDAPEAQAPVVPAEPQRRRVRRKTAAAEAVVEPNEVEAVGEAVELDVTPQEAVEERAEVEALIAEPEPETTPVPTPAVIAEPVEAPRPEADLSEIIANDPNQIAAPPEKPKRGWWRR